jgi:hypothetical protein
VKNVENVSFDHLNVTFSVSGNDMYSIFECVAVANINVNECRIESDSGARTAFKGAGSVYMTKCDISGVNIGVCLDSGNDLDVSQCRFNEIRAQNIYCFGGSACNVSVFDTFFGESDNFGSFAFINVAISESTLRIVFCCFQTSNVQNRKAIYSEGILTIGPENCFRHESETEAITVAEGGIRVYDENECATLNNHYNCQSKCRHVCPTLRFSRTVNFSSSTVFTASNSLSESERRLASDSLSASDRMGLTVALFQSSPASDSGLMSHTEGRSASSAFTDSNRVRLTLKLNASSNFSDTEMSVSVRFTHSYDFSRSFGMLSTQRMISTGRNSISQLIPGTVDFSVSNLFVRSNRLFDSVAFTSSNTLIRAEEASAIPLPLTVPIASTVPVPEGEIPLSTVPRPSTVLPRSTIIHPPSTVHPASTIPLPSTYPVASTVPIVSTVPVGEGEVPQRRGIFRLSLL